MKPPEEHVRRIPFVMTAVAIIAVLYFGRELLIPLALAVFLTFLLFPVVRAAERLGMRRALATALVMIGGGTVVAGGGWMICSEGAEIIENYPQYREKILTKIREVRQMRFGTMGVASRAVEEIIVEINKPVTSAPASQAAVDPNELAPASAPESIAAAPPARQGEAPVAPSSASGDEPAAEEAPPVKVEIVPPRQELVEAQFVQVFGPVMYPMATLGIAVVFVIFFLIFGEDLHARALRALGLAGIEIPPTALADAGARVMRYVSMLGLANLFNGLGIALGLFAIGVPNFLLWGAVSSVLRFIPVVGTWISIVFPTLQAIAMSDGWIQPLLVFALILSVDLLSLNIVEPMLIGARTGASPTAILFAYVFWTWLWGGIGLFLAAPLTVCLVALGRDVPALQGFFVLFGDEPLQGIERPRAADSGAASAIVVPGGVVGATPAALRRSNGARR